MCVVDSATFRLPSAGQEWNQDIVVQCCSPTNGPQSRPGCEEAKTWSEAHDVCEGTGAGLRLCTEAEVLSGGGRGKGCGFDKSHTWVSGGCNLAHPTCNDINGNGTTAFVCPEGSSQPKDSFNTVTCANTTGCTVAECCTSFEVMDISFSTQNWVLSNAGENPPRIDGNVLTIQGDSSRYRLASITLDMPETIDGENNLYFVADVTLRDIVCPEALHWKRPKMAIYNGEDAGNTGAVAIAATYMDPHATDFEFATGSTVMTYAGKVRSGVLSSRMTFEIVLAGCEGTMMVARPKLLNREPTPKIVYPYQNVTEAVATVDLQQDSIKPWNRRLFGANSQFVASKVGSYESSAVSGLLATIRVPELRFPGGKAANYYNWREDRLYDDLWTREDLGRAKTVDRNFTFGFDYFCQSVRASNGSAILVFNVVKDTLQDAVERLRDRLACGLSIDYIELGNENNYKAQSQGKAGGQNATKYAMWTEKIAAALRQELPSVRLSVPLEHHSTWEPGSWNMVLLQEYDYYDAASMHPYANVMGPVFGAAIVKGLLGARSQMEHFVKAYLHAGFAGVPLVLSEWGINYDQGSSPWGLRGNWAFSLAEADMMLYALELGEKGIVDQSSKHILATDFGQGFFKWNGTQFVARPSGAWFLKFIEAARGGYSVKVNVSATMLDPKLGVSSLNAVAFRKTGEYNVLMVNKFDQNAVVKITIDSGGNNRGIRGCEVESLSLHLTDNPMYEMGSDPFSAPSSFDCQTVSVPKLSVAVIRVVVPTCADIDGSGGSFSSCSAGTELAANADVASCYSGYCTASDCCVEVVTADVPSPSSPQATTAAVPSPSQQATQVNTPATCASATFTCQGTSVATANANCGAEVCIASEFASATATCCEAPRSGTGDQGGGTGSSAGTGSSTGSSDSSGSTSGGTGTSGTGGTGNGGSGTGNQGGGDPGSSCKCAEDGSDYKYTEAVEGSTRTVVTSWCPNHYYDDAKLNPNSAYTTGEKTLTMPAMPMLEGSYDLKATGGGVGVLFNGAMVYSAFAGTVALTGYDSSATKLEGNTFDKCGCHSSSTDRESYHCHIPPSCLLHQLGETTGAHSPQVGWAPDGFPVYGPRLKNGVMATTLSGYLDECSGKAGELPAVDNFKYRYYITGEDYLDGNHETDPLAGTDSTNCNKGQTICINPLPTKTYYPFTPLCYKGCCPDGVTCGGTNAKIPKCTASATAGTASDYDAQASIKLPKGLPYYTGDVWDGKTPGKVPDNVCSSSSDSSSSGSSSSPSAATNSSSPLNAAGTPGIGGFVVAAAGIVAVIVARL